MYELFCQFFMRWLEYLNHNFSSKDQTPATTHKIDLETTKSHSFLREVDFTNCRHCSITYRAGQEISQHQNITVH